MSNQQNVNQSKIIRYKCSIKFGCSLFTLNMILLKLNLNWLLENIQNKRTGYKIQYCFEDIQSKKFKRVWS